MLSPIVQQTQFRLARHYLTTLQQSSATAKGKGQSGRVHWHQRLKQDWPQIKQWQAWSAADDATHEQARLCVEFLLANVEGLHTQLTPSEHLHWIEKALRAAQRLGDWPAERALLYKAGFQCLKLEKLAVAEHYADTLLEAAQAAGDSAGVGRAWFLRADSFNRRLRYEDAKVCYGKSREILGEQPSDVLSEILAGLARIEYYSGCYQAALALAARQLETATALGSDRLMGAAHLSMSGMNNQLGQYERAKFHAEHCLAKGRQTGALRLIAHGQFALAHAEKFLGQYERAIALYQEALASPPSVLPPSSRVNATGGLAQVYLLQGDNAQAQRWFDQALTLALSFPDRPLAYHLCDFANQMACLMLQQGALDRARFYLLTAADNALLMGTPPYFARTLLTALRYWSARGWESEAVGWIPLLRRHAHYIEGRTFQSACTQFWNTLTTEAHALETGPPLDLRAVIAGLRAKLTG
jgi:tetratricopeptide (TPR) repeat protein